MLLSAVSFLVVAQSSSEVPEGLMNNPVLERLREKVRQKQPELFANNSWILHHNNAPAHTALSVREFSPTKQIIVLEHPAACSPDLAPMTFFCSRR